MIVSGIPRFVPSENYSDSFGFEWNTFVKTQVDSFNKVGQSVRRIEDAMGWKEKDVKDKLVLDVGCGSGRFVEVMSRWGASIVGLDYSNAVDAAKKVTDELGYFAEYVQGDALQLPFADNTFDAVYSIGVLQHTADPLQALREMCRVLKPGGLFGIGGVYVRNLKNSLHPKYILRPITTKIPTKTLFKIVKMWVKFALPISRFMRKKLHMKQGLVERLLAVANYEGVVPGVDDSNVFEWALLDTFDWFSPTYDNPLTRKEIEDTLMKSGMVQIENVLPEGNNYRAYKKTI
jgi:ubiquinone/menaquinone biosynthesis C-methylase UbiE